MATYRSNRPLTAFAVSKIEEYLSGNGFKDQEAGNTAVSLRRNGDMEYLEVRLFDKPIAQLCFIENIFQGIRVLNGEFFDSVGNPSRTTRERLNGILDWIGVEGLIPEGVRVFLAQDGSACYIGRKELRRPLGDGLPSVTINTHGSSLEFGE